MVQYWLMVNGRKTVNVTGLWQHRDVPWINSWFEGVALDCLLQSREDVAIVELAVGAADKLRAKWDFKKRGWISQ